MPNDPIRDVDVRAWLRKAANDLRAADVDLAADPPLLEDTLFHCQQAAEKSLKAFLTWHDVPFRKTHDLVEIGAQCAEIDETLNPLLSRATELTEYAWAFRYPGETEQITREEATEALTLAREVNRAVCALLPELDSE